MTIHENSIKSNQDEKKSGSNEVFRKAIFECYAQSPVPLTDRQVMNILNENDFNNIRPEITRLKQDGLIFECGKTKCSTTRKTVRICLTSGKEYFSRGS